MTRRIMGLGLFMLAAAGLAVDLTASAPLNPYTAPPLLAWGSGESAAGAHCSSLAGK